MTTPGLTLTWHGHKIEYRNNYYKKSLSFSNPSVRYSKINSLSVTFLLRATSFSLSLNSVSTRAATWITVAISLSPVFITPVVMGCYLLIFIGIVLYLPLFNYIVNKITNYLYNKLYSMCKGRKLILSLTCPLLPNTGRRIGRTFVGGWQKWNLTKE